MLILKNYSTSDRSISDINIVVPAEGQIDVTNILPIRIKQSDDLCVAVIQKEIMVNNGIVDIDDISIAIAHIYGSICLRNTTPNDIEVHDLGITVEAESTYCYPKSIEQLRKSNRLLELVSTGDIVVNDSVRDLGVADTIKYLYGYSTPLLNDRVNIGDRSLMSQDTVRGKTLSVHTTQMQYEKAVVRPLDWITSSYFLGGGSKYTGPYDGTIVSIQVIAVCSNNTTLELWVNGAFNSDIVKINVGDTVVNNTDLNIDFSAGSSIQLRSCSQASLSNVKIILTMRWR